MNKNRYKLIFSKTKGCLVPVAETINSAVGNASSKDVSDTEISASQPALNSPLSTLFVLVKTAFNPVSTLMSLTWKEYAVLLLSVVSFPLMAQASDTDSVVQRKPELTDVTNNTRYHVELDKAHHDAKGDHQTKIKHTENHVIIVDIAKPNQNGISDNRFKKFNIPNGAVFNNSAKEKRSQLVGYLPGNQNLTEGAEAKAILNQVTGPDASKIEGALEILGQKADLVIANQNGIVLNGVKTINANRFVATTSSTIDPEQMQLNVTQGTVTIGVDGFATDGLPYLDIIAKKIEQKQAITKERTGNSETDITFVAGNSKYDLNTHQVTEKHTAEAQGEIAISGASTGAMYGKNIKLIVTDKGAGVKHDGIILSEADIQIETHEGDVELGNTKNNQNENYAKVHAEGNFTVKGGKHVIIGKEVKANKAVDIQAQETTVRQNAKLTAKTSAKIAASKSVNLEDNAKLIANELSTTTDKLTNKGSIYGKKVTLDADNLVNSKEIYASSELDIKTKGRDLLLEDGVNQPLSFLKGTSLLAPGFVNTGLIHSNGNAKLTFKDDTSFVTEGNNFITAKDNLEITAKNVQIDQAKNIQLNANITINTKSGFVNYGTLASAQNLTINTEQGSIYNIGGILGAGKNLNLSAKRGENQGGYLINQGKSLLHSEGAMNLTADRTVYNLGNIFAKGDATINANALINDVTLTGRLEYQDLKKDYTRYYRINETAKHGWHNNVYKLNLNLQEQDKTDIKVVKMGAIRSDGDFDFKGIKATSSESKPQLINHGLINVKGTFNAEADQVVNQMKAFNQNALASVFKNPAKITMYYQPLTRYIWTPLSGNASREFNNLESFLDALFGSTTILKSSFYSTENFSAYQLLSHIQHSPMYQKAMAQVFGAEWHSKSYDEMRNKWKSFKENPTDFIYYPSEKAKILAGKLEGKLTTLQNGEYAERGKFDESIQIGKHQLSLPSVELKAEFSDKERLEEDGVDLSSIAELLEMPNLFIDNSIQLEKKKLSPIEDLDEEPRKNLDIEESHSNSSDDVLSMNDDESDTDDSKWSMGKDEKEMPDDKLGISRDDRGNKPPRTDPTVDYLNPDEFFENGYLLNELLQELGEEPLLKEGEDHFKRSTNLVRLGERDRQNREKREKEGYFDLPGTLDMKLQELFEKRKQKHEAEQKARIEKALLQKSE
ncbi:filamentous hemagglutinin N-terminal domain-containing protein [Pasteurella multocida]|nr:filamentous hemagglutinin N-terminal domain-containing protein [Pasteurella multocida]UZT14951.1 filamentous hemagglutinin N-terminal domain-containing protein [Pasteurella multocida]UZT15278.1 filamentous hemagglutinin N-terminal domain-containing protein [Pasteurella multocida]UZU31330.1 filamentous hemagglutinin N-terminal domain-containing protein [Pasteurella multocida]UZU35988.1 filamentous hemagglutinin N-terminal domain-containing protein [Pasteurella multocida]